MRLMEYEQDSMTQTGEWVHPIIGPIPKVTSLKLF